MKCTGNYSNTIYIALTELVLRVGVSGHELRLLAPYHVSTVSIDISIVGGVHVDAGLGVGLAERVAVVDRDEGHEAPAEDARGTAAVSHLLVADREGGLDR